MSGGSGTVDCTAAEGWVERKDHEMRQDQCLRRRIGGLGDQSKVKVESK